MFFCLKRCMFFIGEDVFLKIFIFASKIGFMFGLVLAPEQQWRCGLVKLQKSSD